MQTLAAHLIDGSIRTFPVKEARYNQIWNVIDIVNEDGYGDFVNLHEKAKWENPYRCSKNDAIQAYLMNDAGQTVARYKFTGWDNCLRHDPQLSV